MFPANLLRNITNNLRSSNICGNFHFNGWKRNCLPWWTDSALQAPRDSLARQAATHVARVLLDAEDGKTPVIDMKLITLKPLLSTLRLASARAEHARGELFKLAQTGIIPECSPGPGEVETPGDARRTGRKEVSERKKEREREKDTCKRNESECLVICTCNRP